MQIRYDYGDNEWVLFSSKQEPLFRSRIRDDCLDELDRLLLESAEKELAEDEGLKNRP